MAYCRWLNEQLRKLAPERLATAKPAVRIRTPVLARTGRRFPGGRAALGGGMGKSGARRRWPDLSVGRRTRPQSRQLRRDRSRCDQRGGLFSWRRQPLRLRGDERQRLGMDAQSIWRLSLSARRPKAPSAGRPECARQRQPGAAGRRVPQRCEERALRLPLRPRPVDRYDYYGFRVVVSPFFSDR